MEQPTDAQLFDELATQLEEAAGRRASGESIVIDAPLISCCMSKMRTLQNGIRPDPKLISSAFTLFDEVSSAIGKWLLGSDDPLDDGVRYELFTQHIGSLDNLMHLCDAKETDLEDVAMFLRSLAIGIESFRIKLLKQRHDGHLKR
jgi:hypothetical protein